MAHPTHTLRVQIATPLGLVLDTNADSVQAPSVLGEFGVLPEHIPLLAALKAGVVRYRVEGKDLVAAVGPGFVEADAQRVQILTEQFAKPEAIDVAAVQKELAECEAEMKTATDAATQTVLERRWQWAQARLDVVAQAARG